MPIYIVLLISRNPAAVVSYDLSIVDQGCLRPATGYAHNQMWPREA